MSGQTVVFSRDIAVSLLPVEEIGVDVIQVDAGIGSSLLQARKDFITLDGGRPFDVFGSIKPLDGGEV